MSNKKKSISVPKKEYVKLANEVSDIVDGESKYYKHTKCDTAIIENRLNDACEDCRNYISHGSNDPCESLIHNGCKKCMPVTANNQQDFSWLDKELLVRFKKGNQDLFYVYLSDEAKATIQARLIAMQNVINMKEDMLRNQECGSVRYTKGQEKQYRTGILRAQIEEIEDIDQSRNIEVGADGDIWCSSCEMWLEDEGQSCGCNNLFEKRLERLTKLKSELASIESKT